MKNTKGITLISLVIMIIVLLILASVAIYSGKDIVKSSKFTAFSTELKIMQTQVNAMYQDNDKANLGAEIEGSVKTQADKVFTASESGITSQEGYKYWNQQLIKELGIEGVEQDFFINLEKRSVISYEGFEYEGKKYYTLQQIPNGLYNVDYDNPNTGKPTFEVNVEQIESQRWKITIPKESINYTSGYIDKWQVQYQLEGTDYWNTTEDLSFIVEEKGNYQIKIQNGDIVSEEKSILVEGVPTTVEEAIRKGTALSETDNITIKDAYENSITIPAGFKIVSDDTTNNANTVDKGIVVEEVSSGNQFVWVPVGKIYTTTDTATKESTAKTITLGRYSFATDGTPRDYTGSYKEENAKDTENLLNYGNAIAKDIEGFKTSVEHKHGYYIGRYEARTATARTTNTDALTSVTLKGTDYVYNYVTQLQASERCGIMYGEDKPFTSDLINSYAWDTAIIFEQTFDDRSDKTTPYSKQTSLNSSLARTGTTTDKICNIYDMASNVAEWSTETSLSDTLYVNRGGNYAINYNNAGRT